ncbi:type ISP restriction/modification enzyme [Oceaniradius stylonematis]|uniref:type ISP restriction/modification enzyme n=1 Tax=Oceaniradius stylonematis TaxID=2184161 RepID=UPI0035CF1EAC
MGDRLSRQLVQTFLNELDRIKKYSGSINEQTIREAFKDLLKAWSRQNDLIFLAELEHNTPQNTTVRPDGAILHGLRVPLGYWEAKDTSDDLDEEIRKKLAKGYPQDNIIFENSETAVLWQHRQEAFRCRMDDTENLLKLLGLFFGYERPEIAEFRKAVEQFKADLPHVLDALRERIDWAYDNKPEFQNAARKFLDHVKGTVNPTLGEADVREMLIQHVLTEEIFAHVFNEADFHRDNNIARELYALEAEFFTGAVKKDTLRSLEPYYAAIRANAAQISSHQEKQTFLKLIYENFYKVYNPKAADRLGVVYTPNEIVRFMIEGADWLCQKHFGKALIDRDVEILDPATGTGTFICELIEHFRGQPDKLAHKYKEELHANEVAILPYYVANLNIEATYAAVTGQFAEYPNLCFVDTLDNVAGLGIRAGHQMDLLGALSDENIERVKRQNRRKISVIIGNPPYNANQQNENDNNKNREYKRIDELIKSSYIRQSTAQKTKQYDMYKRFFRWASDRLHDDGIIAFVTNSAFIEARQDDGFRKCVTEDFSEIFLIDLKGNARTSGERRRREGGNIFEDQIRVGVAISFWVKKKAAKGSRIFYQAVRDYAKADEKRDFVNSAKLADRFDGGKMQEIEPSKRGNWINQIENEWDDLIPVATKAEKAGKKGSKDRAIFRLYSNGIVTARDDWMTDISRGELEKKSQHFLEAFSQESRRWKQDPDSAIKDRSIRLARLRDFVSREIKWTSELEQHADKGTTKAFLAELIRSHAYRPYSARFAYYDTVAVHRTYQQRDIFPIGSPGNNRLIGFSGVSAAKPFQTLAVDRLPSYDFLEKTQFLPRYRYSKSGEKIDNITDWALRQFKAEYGKAVTKDDIFHYVYGVLHDPVYRETYAINLKREFPRIPFYPDFQQWVDWGKALMELHIGYEAVEPWPLERLDTPDEKARQAGVAPKAMLKADRDNGIIRLDSETQLSGIPPEVWDYRLGNRSAVEWILDQYKEKKPKDPTIREKFNTYRFADYKETVIDLLMRVTRVSVETVAITEAMKGVKRAEE